MKTIRRGSSKGLGIKLYEQGWVQESKVDRADIHLVPAQVLSICEWSMLARNLSLKVAFASVRTWWAPDVRLVTRLSTCTASNKIHICRVGVNCIKKKGHGSTCMRETYFMDTSEASDPSGINPWPFPDCPSFLSLLNLITFKLGLFVQIQFPPSESEKARTKCSCRPVIKHLPNLLYIYIRTTIKLCSFVLVEC